MDFQNSKHLVAAAQKMRAEYLKRAQTTAISVQQKASCRNDPIKGPLWVSKFTLPIPTDDTSRGLLLQLVDEANEHQVRYDRPASVSLDFEWVAYRRNVQKDTPEPAIGEKEKYDRVMAETTSPLTILYLYGGSFVLNSASSYRKTAAALSQATGAKVLLVRQRLAPQNPFPAALLDAFQAYLTLLHPPPQVAPTSPCRPPRSSWRATVRVPVWPWVSSRSCSGCSVGGATITFHGSTEPPVVPAGMSLLSPVADLTNAFPSFERNARCDIFPVPIEKLPYLEKSFPTCPAWPTRPPRANLYCEAGMLAHPLASPAAAEDWTGTCPIWMGSGQEQIVDASRLVAREIHRAGGSITLREYESMPHTFFWVFGAAPQTKQILGEWAQAAVRFARGEQPPSSAQFIWARSLKAESLEVENLVPFTLEQAQEWMWKKTHGYQVPGFHRKGSRSSL
ncbi:hypothetical protein N7533_011647 [Penicillium manginii]|uniref:uncharacterized protein n=1 Tax=Penicillium manginii TaxID=203109 RepID=UPI002548BFCF|nr:uncharacterized protein N7533_011647 [Penicillium manginii]KAJ5742238.1 hypothetical protein N7533_011647 [Penicillium manginii]